MFCMRYRQTYQKLFCWFLKIKTSGKYAGALFFFMPMPFDFSARHNLNISISYFYMKNAPLLFHFFSLRSFTIDQCQFQLTATWNDFFGKFNEIARKIRFCTSFAPISIVRLGKSVGEIVRRRNEMLFVVGLFRNFAQKICSCSYQSSCCMNDAIVSNTMQYIQSRSVCVKEVVFVLFDVFGYSVQWAWSFSFMYG